MERAFAFEDLVEYYIAEHGLSPPVSGCPQGGGEINFWVVHFCIDDSCLQLFCCCISHMINTLGCCVAHLFQISFELRSVWCKSDLEKHETVLKIVG